MAPSQPHYCSCPSFHGGTEECTWANCPASATGRDLPARRDPHPLLEADLVLPLFCVSKALLQPVLDCVVFFLATLAPRCSGQKCLEPFPGTGNLGTVLCSTLTLQGGNLEMATSLFSLPLICQLAPSAELQPEPAGRDIC